MITDWYTKALHTETPRSIRHILATCRDPGNRAFLTQEETRELHRLDMLRAVVGGTTQ